MFIKLAKMFIVLFIVSMFITLFIFTRDLQKNFEKHIWSANLNNLTIGSNIDSYKNLISNRALFQTYKSLLQANENLETTVKCVGSLKNQSCLFKNLYYINRTFYILTTKKVHVPLPSVRIGPSVISRIHPDWRRFYSYTDLDEFVKSIVNPIVIPNVTLYFDQIWLMNIGHALFDGLYPAYIALIRFPPRHLQPFRILLRTSGINGNHSFTNNVYNRFAGLDTINATILDEMTNGKWIAFQELVMGSGEMCQRCLQPNLQLAGGVELNGSQLFRDRMYKQHGLSPPLLRQNHSAERRHSLKPLKAYIIDNKRFTREDRLEIIAAINHINIYTNTYRNKITEKNQTKLLWPLVDVTYISYSLLTTTNNNSTELNSKDDMKMMIQLQLLKDMDIHVTGPGTGQMYQTFLSDGSININLGGLNYLKQNITIDRYTSFLEQYMTSGTPYIKGLYYPIEKRLNGIKKDIIIELINKAAQLILDGFSIPINPRDNLAPDGQLFREMCELDKTFCLAATDKWQINNRWCASAWPETIAYEIGPWSPEGIMVDGQHITCPCNRTLLNQLREKYNINFKFKSRSFESKLP